MPIHVEDHEAGRSPDVLFGVQVVVNPQHQGKGLSSVAVRVMAGIAQELSLPRLVIPVRPDGKARFPLVPMDTYTAWKDADGLPADNWLRVHARAGGRMGGLDGEHVVPGALVPVRFDHSVDQGVVHDIG